MGYFSKLVFIVIIMCIGKDNILTEKIKLIFAIKNKYYTYIKKTF